MTTAKSAMLCRALVLSSALLTSFGLPAALACGGHAKRQPKSPSEHISPPTRPLEWGDLNIIHTTDTHGWLLGHLKSEQPEPNASGDFGDFQSFVLRMKEQAKKKKVDLLVIDTGDLHDGNGLSDAEPLVHPGTPRGTSSDKFFARVPYDLLAIGNHELYDLPIAQDMHDNFAPLWNGSYLTSNVNITTSGVSVPLGSRYRKLTTEHGRKVTAFGIIFDFRGNAKGTVVQPPAELVKEQWFKEAIYDKPDVFILTGHMAISDSDWMVVFGAIRALHPEVPIVILGGHLHIRDCRQLDDRSMSLASGRYMETIGWMSLKGLKPSDHKLKFSRRYLDPNRVSYAFHAGLRFDTPSGLATSNGLFETAAKFNITHRFGVAPQSFFAYRVPPTAPNSLNQLFTGPDGVLETVIKNSSRPYAPLVVVNTGAMRFDIFEGNFTVNDELITMPFENRFLFVPDVPRATADKFLAAMNSGGAARHRSSGSKVRRDLKGSTDVTKDEQYHLGHDVEAHYHAWLQAARQEHEQLRFVAEFFDDEEESDESLLLSRSASEEERNQRTYGYVTRDQCPGVGDDVVHEPMPVFEQPDYIGTALPQNTTTIDVVFYSFIQNFALQALNKAQSETNKQGTGGNMGKIYTTEDVRNYTDVVSNQMLGIYAEHKWNSKK